MKENELEICCRLQDELPIIYPNSPLWLNSIGWVDWKIEKEFIKMVDTKNYSMRAKLLESNDWNKISPRIEDVKTLRTLHGLIGIGTESGELQDILKKYIFYGKPIDEVNLKEELGDLLWYMNLLLCQYNWTIEEVMEANIAKLEYRYKDKQFKETQALGVDLEGERKILEGKI